MAAGRGRTPGLAPRELCLGQHRAQMSLRPLHAGRRVRNHLQSALGFAPYAAVCGGQGWAVFPLTRRFFPRCVWQKEAVQQLPSLRQASRPAFHWVSVQPRAGLGASVSVCPSVCLSLGQPHGLGAEGAVPTPSWRRAGHLLSFGCSLFRAAPRTAGSPPWVAFVAWPLELWMGRAALPGRQAGKC